jgi:ABC-type multidrug transport system ATPase subunit
VTPTKGAVKFDGKPLAELDLRAVRQQIGIVPQHPYIFGATLRENISLTAPEASNDRVMYATALAAFDADVSKMPMGLDTMVSDGGASLSGGQRQRIALARAVLRDPAVLLLDEATSALDTTTEARVTASLRNLRATRVVIAHRLSTVAGADLIIVMDKGKIVEQGSHAQLLGKQSMYRQLVAASGGAVPALPQGQPAAQPAKQVAGQPQAQLPAGPSPQRASQPQLPVGPGGPPAPRASQPQLPSGATPDPRGKTPTQQPPRPKAPTQQPVLPPPATPAPMAAPPQVSTRTVAGPADPTRMIPAEGMTVPTPEDDDDAQPTDRAGGARRVLG